jgi:phosphatidylserine/phosphatidylglycerophosphate/cardiolipin synthase-like enzyme
MRPRWRRIAILALAAAWVGMAWWQAAKPLPPGMHIASAACAVPAADIAFIADITAADAYGRAAVSQGIFDEVLRVVGGARRFIVLDYSRFGPAEGSAPARRLAAQLTDALLARRRALPELAVLFITDPANENYGAAHALDLQLLRAAGVQIVVADLDALRDSNFVYSSLWRLGVRWWHNPGAPFGIATRRLNFKADERKLILADDGRGGLTAVLGSANPLDAESAWSNVAARITGAALPELLASELAVARFSGWRGNSAAFAVPGAPASAAAHECMAAPAGVPAPAGVAGSAGASLQVLTEGAIGAVLLPRLDAAEQGDAIDVAAFYLAERGVVEALLAAARRGVRVRLILDPNEGARSGGAEGIPNQPVAAELVSRSGGAIHVRWYRTHGERFHSALAMIYGRERLWLTIGSANLTRRSLSDYNLEANLAVELARAAPLAQQALGYFDTLWGNRAGLGIEYTADFAAFANPAQSDYWLCRLLEGAGLGAF